MKVSLNLVQFVNKKYNCGPDPYQYGVDQLIERLGLQLGAIESVEYIGKKYDGVLVATVVTCEKHENADKLSVCLIDDGGVQPDVDRDEQGYVQVVCGAPNVRAGLSVAWLPPGATVPSTFDTDPFVLSAREIRGVISNGMLASPQELGISDNHDGILEIDASDVGESNVVPGVAFKNLYGLDDVVIDCENKMFTHRPDCFGTMGVAREIAGIFGDSFVSPTWYTSPLPYVQEASLPLDVINEVSEKVPRFCVQTVADVTVKSSPMWLQSYLSRIGNRSINNIVDYTNFYMMETGQPLHAYDYDKVAAFCDGPVTIFPRMAQEGEQIALLNGKTITLTANDIVIATDQKAIGLAGVMGGSETEVDENTKNIIIECANFDMYTIRRTSMRHGLFTDAVTRFTKGQSPLQNEAIIAKMVNEVVTSAGGTVASELYDLAAFDVTADNLNHVEVSTDFINDRLGSALSAEQIKNLLENVEFQVTIVDEELTITAPFWRMDIALPEDIVEEVGRLYGFSNLLIELPKRSSKPARRNLRRDFARGLAEKLSRAGANEVLTYSFVHGDVLRGIGVNPEHAAYHLRNALSPDLQYYRTSLLASLLAKVRGNSKAQAGQDDNEFALFEVGKVHVKGVFEEREPGLPKEQRRLGLVFVADAKAAKKYHGAPFYQAKHFLETLTEGQATYEPVNVDVSDPSVSMFMNGRCAKVMINETQVGIVGEFSHHTARSFKLPEFSAGFELDLDALQSVLHQKNYSALSNFPGSHQDVTYEVAREIEWAELSRILHAELAVAKAEQGYSYTLSPMDIFQAEGKTEKRVSFRIELAHHEKTLTTQEVSTLLDQISEAAHASLDAKRI